MLLHPPAAAAQAPDPSLALTQLRRQHWGDAEGLPMNSVHSVTQTPDGYLWVATEQGAATFDGVRFTPVTPGRSGSLATAFVHVLLREDADVWVGTDESAVWRLSAAKQVKAFIDLRGIHAHPQSLAHGGGDTVWIGTSDAGLFRSTQGRLTRVAGLPHDFITSVIQDKDGTVWAGTPIGLVRMRGGEVKLLRRADGLPDDEVMRLVRVPDGRILVGTKGGIAEIRDGVLRRPPGAMGVLGTYVNAVFMDSRGVLWVGTHGSGLIRVVEERTDTLRMGPGESMSIVNAIFEDRDGSIWVGTNGDGLYELRETRLTVLGRPEGLPADIALALMEARDHTMWIGTAGGGLLRQGKDGTRVFSTRDGLPHPVILSVTEDRQGAIWAGTPSGVARIAGEKVERLTAAEALRGVTVLAMFTDALGRVWAGTNGAGLVRLRPGPVRTFGTQDGLPSGIVNSMTDDGGGGLLVGTRRGLAHLMGDRFVGTGEGAMVGDVGALLRDPDGTLWMGVADLGLVRLRDGHVAKFTRAQGMPDIFVHAILPDSGYLWVSSNLGIARVARRDLEAVASGRQARVDARTFGITDGMRSREANGGIFPAGWRAHDGRLWFPTISGAVIVDPSRQHRSITPPMARIELVTTRDSTYARVDSLRVPAGSGNLRFAVTAPTFIQPGDVTFRYRLEGFDPAWITGERAREIRYTNLSPGRYTFRVSASSSATDVPGPEDSMTVTLVPTFWQRRSVWLVAAVLGGLGLAAAGSLAQQRRVARLTAQQNVLLALVAERTAAEQRYRDLFDNGIEAIFITDDAGRIVQVNRRFAELTGRSAASLIGLPVEALLPEGSPPGAADPWRGPLALAEVEMTRPDGTLVPLEVGTQLLRDASGVTGMQTVARDLTEQRDLREQLRQAQKMEAVGRFAGGVAHDFNNLLTVILGFAGLLEEGLQNGDASPNDLAEIRKAADLAAALTRQLLTFSRRQIVQPSSVQVNELLGEIEPMLRRLLAADIAFDIIRDPSLPPIHADAGQVEMLVMNLAVNAGDAMPEGGTLHIATRALESGHVELVVRDTGEGMSPEVREKVFEPFFTTKARGKGTGLGLATVYGIVKHFGGTIEFQSEVGRGTTFRITFPAGSAPSPSPSPAPAVTAGPKEGGTGRGEFILVVEDEDALRSLIHRMLLTDGYRVLDAHDGEAALAIMKSPAGEHVSLVLSDVVMPGISGAALADELLRVRPACDVVFTSGYMDDDILRRRLRDRGRRLLPKPFTAEELSLFVRSALEASRATATD